MKWVFSTVPLQTAVYLFIVLVAFVTSILAKKSRLCSFASDPFEGRKRPLLMPWQLQSSLLSQQSASEDKIKRKAS